MKQKVLNNKFLMKAKRWRVKHVKMTNKKGVELQINTLIIIIIAILVLVITIFIFSSAAREWAANIMAKLKAAFGMWNATRMP